MKNFLGAALLLGCAAMAGAQTHATHATHPTKAPSVSETLMQTEHDWLEATRTANLDRLNEIIADDWVGIGFGLGGERATKQQFLDSIKSGAVKFESFEMGPMSVKVLGNVAVVQGSNTQKATSNGHDDSGKHEWMDVFAKRGGKWVAVRSQEAKAE